MSFERHQRRRFSSWDNVHDANGQEGRQEVRDIQWPFYSIGRPDDVLQPKGDACQKISKLLGRVVQGGRTCSFGREFDGLPVLPGLSVKSFGGVSLPLRKEQASLIASQGVDEDNVWTLLPYQVEMTNPQWGIAIQKLCELSADELGFKGIALQPILSKVAVYGAGGRRVVQQDAYEHDRVVAKLVVQLPSEYTGGDMLVSGAGMNGLRCYDFGNVDDTAAFKPHYAVYAADAFCAVKEVTSGYRLVVEYSLYLPSELVVINGKVSFDLLQMQVQIAEAMKNLKEPGEYEVKPEIPNGRTEDGENAMVALILSQTCTRLQIKTKGVNALSGMDRDRFKLLLDANALLPPEKQLRFYFVCLQHTNRNNSRVYETKMSASWYQLSGEKLGDDSSIDWTKRLNFLNPDNEKLGQLWRDGEGHLYWNYIYERCAVVGWPVSTDIALSYKLMGEFAAMASILANNPIDTAKLRKLFTYRANHLGEAAEATNYCNTGYGYDYGYAQTNQTMVYSVVPLAFCQNLCKAIGELGDHTLVDMFVKKYFIRLYDKIKLIPALAELVRTFSWGTVGASIVCGIDGLLYDILMKLALLLADELKDCQVAQAALTKYGLKKLKGVAVITPSVFAASPDLGLLWKNAMACEDPQVFRDVENLAKTVDIKLLGPVVSALSQYVNRSSSLEHRAVLVTIACSRLQWLAAEIAEMEKPFEWQIVIADFPDTADIVTFLQGPSKTLELYGFSSIVEARVRMKLLHTSIKAPVEITANGRGSLSFVKIVKIGGVFAKRTQKMTAYRVEVERLTRLLQLPDENSNTENADTSNATNENIDTGNTESNIETMSIAGKKHPREEETNASATSKEGS